jgi:hypothetical protein
MTKAPPYVPINLVRNHKIPSITCVCSSEKEAAWRCRGCAQASWLFSHGRKIFMVGDICDASTLDLIDKINTCTYLIGK